MLFNAVYPVIVVLQVIPKEALAPLLVLWFGAGILSRTILAFLIAFFPMVLNTILGVRGLHPDIRNYADSLVCGRWQLFAKVEFPSSLTSIFAGMKISATLSIIGVVVAEIVAGRSGLPATVRVQPPGHGFSTGDISRSRGMGRCTVLRNCIC
jgi:NitT/TauT family transport system permease protein